MLHPVEEKYLGSKVVELLPQAFAGPPRVPTPQEVAKCFSQVKRHWPVVTNRAQCAPEDCEAGFAVQAYGPVVVGKGALPFSPVPLDSGSFEVFCRFLRDNRTRWDPLEIAELASNFQRMLFRDVPFLRRVAADLEKQARSEGIRLAPPPSLYPDLHKLTGVAARFGVTPSPHLRGQAQWNSLAKKLSDRRKDQVDSLLQGPNKPRSSFQKLMERLYSDKEFRQQVRRTAGNHVERYITNMGLAPAEAEALRNNLNQQEEDILHESAVRVSLAVLRNARGWANRMRKKKGWSWFGFVERHVGQGSEGITGRVTDKVLLEYLTHHCQQDATAVAVPGIDEVLDTKELDDKMRHRKLEEWRQTGEEPE